jgi:hypothetical protein
MKSEAKVYLLEIIVTREYVRDAEVLHDYHAREIDEGDVQFIVVLLPHLPGAAKLLRRDVDQQIFAGVYFG